MALKLFPPSSGARGGDIIIRGAKKHYVKTEQTLSTLATAKELAL